MHYIAEASESAPPQQRATQYLIRSAFFIGSFWALNQVAYLFEVSEGVSLFYPPSAFAMFLIYLFGARYLPAHFLAILLGGLPERDIINYDLELFIPDLRQFLIYGLAGLLLRQIHPDNRIINGKFLYSLMIAAVLTAFVSVLVFMMGSGLENFGSEPLLQNAPSFFVGNLTGAITAIPIFLFFHYFMRLGWQAFKASLAQNLVHPAKSLAFLGVILLTAAVIQLGQINETLSQYYYLILLPIVWATVKWGLGIGLGFAFFSNILGLQLFILSELSNYGILEVQIMFAISIITVILIGQLQDQKDAYYRRSMYDHLTGLANMRLFDELALTLMAQARRKGQQLAILFIDIDGFKFANDTLGHKAGDALLKSLSRKMKGCIRASDCIARYGGDEFVICLADASEAGATEVAETISQSLSVPMPVKDQTATLGASVGIAMYPRDGADLETLIQKADEAMYSAKTEAPSTPRLADRPD